MTAMVFGEEKKEKGVLLAKNESLMHFLYSPWKTKATPYNNVIIHFTLEPSGTKEVG